MHQRFHILAGPTCNNNCVFCMEDDRADRKQRHELITPERVLQLLRDHVPHGEVMFTSGEPTLNRNLPTYVQWARRLGYRTVGLTTNARRLRYEPYTRQLLEQGLNHVVVSIHGPDARSHDGQTRSPGSFVETVAGLEVLARLRGPYRCALHTSTVVGQRNHRRLREVYELLRRFDVDQYIFNVMQPLGRGALLLQKLVARYRDVADEFARFLAAVGEPLPPVYLVDLPRCTTEGLPDPVRGYVEFAFFTEYEIDGRPRPRVSKLHKEEENRVKRDDCRRCNYDAPCTGVWRNYVEAYGWDEFVPVARQGRLAPKRRGRRPRPATP
ncbi:MAG: radical SAM protein [Deltaproteobacteria bacterium]|nr:radical SAM protein [Deltaproteobacteria bacterium]